MNTTDERRQQKRPQPLKPNLRMFFLLKADKVASCFFSSSIKIAISTIVICMCCGLMVWSLYYRLPSINQSILLIQQQTQLQFELDGLHQQLPADKLKAIEAIIAQEKAHVFKNYIELAVWLNIKSDFAKDLKLDMSYQLKNHQQTGINDIYSQEIEIKLLIKKSSVNNGYAKQLEFIRSLIDENWRLEITGNELISLGNGVNSVTINLLIWIYKTQEKGSPTITSKTNAEEIDDIPFIQ